MKTILHRDDWVEIPAGEFASGLTDGQRADIVFRLLEQVGAARRPEPERILLESAARKLRRYPRVWLDQEEADAFFPSNEVPGRTILIEESLSAVPPQQIFHLERFYIARYPLTERQYYLFTHGTPAAALPSCLEEPESSSSGDGDWKGEVRGRRVAAVRTDEAVRLSLELGARLPTVLEWEKAARGTDGRLYPWGNEWLPDAGFFFPGQDHPGPGPDPGRSVTGYPRGVSPYGVAFMAGGLPELVEVAASRPIQTQRIDWHGRSVLVDIKGCHAKESSQDLAWFDHILALPGRGFWVSLRPVLDRWPRTQWPGFDASDAQTGG